MARQSFRAASEPPWQVTALRSYRLAPSIYPHPQTPMPSIRDLARALEAWAPPASAQSYDNVGLQVGDSSREITGVIVALDLTSAVIDEAAAAGANLIVTHHPLLFRPLRALTPSSQVGALALRLAERGIALYTAHTNLDAARGGVSFALAETLGLQNVQFLQGESGHLVKLAVFVPGDHAGAVREALAGAGAGQIGEYEACAFGSSGTGYFRPTEAARPYQGEPGGALESAEEVRLEVLLPRWKLGQALGAARAAHPYEEMAYDVFAAEQADTRVGMGALGALPEAELLPAFLARVAKALGSEALRYAGRDDQRIRTVAVCGGAGRDLIGAARRAGADAYVTADLTYHTFFDALGPGGEATLALIDAGHYETEQMTEALLVDFLRGAFPGVEISATALRTSPMRTFAPERP